MFKTIEVKLKWSLFSTLLPSINKTSSSNVEQYFFCQIRIFQYKQTTVFEDKFTVEVT